MHSAKLKVIIQHRQQKQLRLHHGMEPISIYTNRMQIDNKINISNQFDRFSVFHLDQHRQHITITAITVSTTNRLNQIRWVSWNAKQLFQNSFANVRFRLVHRIRKMSQILRWRQIQAAPQQQLQLYHWLHNLPVQNKIHLRTKIIIIIIVIQIIIILTTITIALPDHRFQSDFMVMTLVLTSNNHINR